MLLYCTIFSNYHVLREKGIILIIGLGVDLVELNRIEKVMHRNDRFTKRVLTNKEIEMLDQKNSNSRKVEFVAGRFAAKEAYAKANGTGIGKELSFLDIEVFPNENGKPEIYINGSKNNAALLSISHSKEFVVAQVIIQEG
jgi:holo-[acyl-carrier protein] synthase